MLPNQAQKPNAKASIPCTPQHRTLPLRKICPLLHHPRQLDHKAALASIASDTFLHPLHQKKPLLALRLLLRQGREPQHRDQSVMSPVPQIIMGENESL